MGDNDLWTRVHAVLLGIFCRGVLKSDSKWLIGQSLFSIALSPMILVLVLIKRAIHLAILLTAWWFLREEVAPYGSLLLSLALVAIFYKDIYQELQVIVLYLAVIVTGGGFLRWMCAGYLSTDGFRQEYLMRGGAMEEVVSVLVRAIPDEYHNQYEEVMDLYSKSNEPGKEEELNSLLEKHERGTA
jgi:hypothetical protein